MMGNSLADKIGEPFFVRFDLAIADGIGFIEDNDIQNDDLSPDVVGEETGIANPFAREFGEIGRRENLFSAT